MSTVALMWFRKDLRLADNEALTSAAEAAETLACVAVAEQDASGDAPSSASHRWRVASLASLDAELRSRGGALALLGGPAERTIPDLARRIGASVVFCSRDHAPEAILEERRVAQALRQHTIGLVALPGQLLVAPGELSTASGSPFRVFTPFFRAWLRAIGPGEPLPAPRSIRCPAGFAEDHRPLSPGALGLGSPADDPEGWVPGERAASLRLERFAEAALASYATLHDRPDVDGTSELSPRLAFGELSPRQVVSAAFESAVRDVALPFVRQVAWREFSYHVLAAFPELGARPWRPEYSAMPWRDDPQGVAAWSEGRTGFPLVDAGMRQLAATGWMHNRVRLVAASFLTKDLLVPWQLGERFFADRLVDYDPAANPFNWQWVAGSGADASPYFRVFNPVTQGAKFDPRGDYVRRWLPELKWISERWVHHPWDAPERELRQARVALDVDYPRPVLDHGIARRRALAAFEEVRSSRRTET
jgi:deoxyribodipyrimidine photo-lyase